MVYGGRETTFELYFEDDKVRRYPDFGHALKILQARYRMYFNPFGSYEGQRLGVLPLGYAHLFRMRMCQEGAEPSELSGKDVCYLAFMLGYDTEDGLQTYDMQSERALDVVEHFLHNGVKVPYPPMSFSFD